MTSKYLPQLESETEYSFWVKASTSIGVGGNSTVVRQMTQESSKCTFPQSLWHPCSVENMVWSNKTVSLTFDWLKNEKHEKKTVLNKLSFPIDQNTKIFFWWEKFLFSVPANIFYDNLPVTLATRSTSAILECEAYGYPEPSVMWYSSGRELTDTTKYRLLTNGSLEIISVREADAGDYECTASNKLGIKTVIRKLKVKSKLMTLNFVSRLFLFSFPWREENPLGQKFK